MQIPASAKSGAIAIVICLLAATGYADEKQAEIEYLLASVGSSNCLFIRNGKEHSADEGESHLRMKYRRAEKYIDDAETFIEKIASQSSWTRQAYLVRCPGLPEQPSMDWLTARLTEYRETGTAAGKPTTSPQ